ncbi:MULTISPECIES: trehalose operon repressor [Streptococcus]|uniref:Trehalose operon repressor n=1 Tax=Streptococcus caledonicus TaxID=2614158 RepID=A0ABW0UE39_9STRE|nr:trehalose operon repressor [Streptococcus sp. S784/96/1]
MKKYERIYKELEQDILSGHYPVEHYLPTEMELCEQFTASRDTVRKALSLLTKEGLISKSQGRGSQVKKQELINFPVSELSSYQELVALHGMNSKTNVISLNNLIVDKDLRKLTGFPIGAHIFRITRQRVVDSIASVLDIDYLLKPIVPSISREIAEQSIYAYLEKELNLAISYAQKQITIDNARDQDKILLDLGSDKHVVCIRSKVYLADNRQFQFTESRHKLEKFQFIDFARRKL